jgi:molybdopterin/thiamine biosynthesis adenylyltransferase
MNRLVFAGDELSSLRGALMSQAPREAAAVVLVSVGKGAKGTRLLARDSLVVPPEGYLIQEPARLSFSPEILVPVLKKARNEGWSLVLVHTHPFGGHVFFSAADDEGEAKLMPAIFGRAPDRPHGALVLGGDGFDGRLRWSPTSAVPIDSLTEAGERVRVYGKRAGDDSLNEAVLDRQIRAFGTAGQAMLRKLCVGIVGLGGLGSIVAEQLAHLGVGSFFLLDPETLESSNLNRVVGATDADVGRGKAEVCAENIRRIHRDASVQHVIGSALREADARQLVDCDLVVGCTDSHGSRAVLNQLAYQYYVPTFDLGVRIDADKGRITRVSGRVQMLAPRLGCLVCQGLLDPEEVRRDLLSPTERARDPYIVGANEPQPSVIALNGVIASLGVTMLLGAVTGLPAPRHQIYLGERGLVRAVDPVPVPGCIVCSSRGALGRGDSWSMPWRLG